jgi:ribonuclease J
MEDPRISVPNYKDGVRVLEKARARSQTWEDSICSKWGTVSTTEIHERQDKYVLVVPPADIQNVLRISTRPGSVFLFSSSEPFNEEMELDYDRLMNWLDAIGMPAYKVHASGHAMPMDLRRFVSEVKPRIVVPIHGEHPEMVVRYFRDLGSEVYLPTVGEPIPL